MKKLRINLARLVLSNYPLPRGIHLLTKICLLGISEFPERATFKFKYGCFVDVSIKKWPFGYWDLYFYGQMDVDELFLWKKFINKGDVVVDVGANYGYWTLVGSKLVGKNGKVISFEPIEKTYKTLTNNLENSNAHNVTAYNLALSNVEKKETFNISSTDDVGGQSSQGTTQHIVNFDAKVEVQMVSLDNFVNDDTKIKLIKIDIEGGELFALKGMERIISNQKPIITFEWNVNTAESMNYHPDDILDYLKSFGYHIYINESKILKDFDRMRYPKDRVLMLWAIVTAP